MILDYLAIQADETTDTATHCQLVLVLRYIDSLNKVQERFYEFIQLQNSTADTVATAVLERLNTFLPEGQRGKLIAQVYDGAAVMRGATGGCSATCGALKLKTCTGVPSTYTVMLISST